MTITVGRVVHGGASAAQLVSWSAHTKLLVLVGVQGEDAKRLEWIAQARGQTAAEVVAELLHDAERAPG